MTSAGPAAIAIQEVVSTMMDRVLQRVLVEDPFVKEAHYANKPLYAALVPDEIFKGSHFERRFVTPFGGVWEKLAVVAAQQAHGHGEKGYAVCGTVGDERLRRIQEVLNKLEHKHAGDVKQKPDWGTELAYVLAGKGKPIPVTVVCDIFVHSKSDGKRYAFELDDQLPSRSSTRTSKEKMFKLFAMLRRQVDDVFYVPPHSGHLADEQWAAPKRWFDLRNDPCVMIGNNFWDFMGGPGTYALLAQKFNQIGNFYRAQICREYLGVESLPATNSNLLQ
jgi:hypothetical protein